MGANASIYGNGLVLSPWPAIPQTNANASIYGQGLVSKSLDGLVLREGILPFPDPLVHYAQALSSLGIEVPQNLVQFVIADADKDGSDPLSPASHRSGYFVQGYVQNSLFFPCSPMHSPCVGGLRDITLKVNHAWPFCEGDLHE